jgi:hypothetical protein
MVQPLAQRSRRHSFAVIGYTRKLDVLRRGIRFQPGTHGTRVQLARSSTWSPFADHVRKYDRTIRLVCHRQPSC